MKVLQVTISSLATKAQTNETRPYDASHNAKVVDFSYLLYEINMSGFVASMEGSGWRGSVFLVEPVCGVRATPLDWRNAA